jgi:hypothetical protein
MSHQAPTVTQSLSGKLRILDHKYLRTVEPWLPVAVWGLLHFHLLLHKRVSTEIMEETKKKRTDLDAVGFNSHGSQKIGINPALANWIIGTTRGVDVRNSVFSCTKLTTTKCTKFFFSPEFVQLLLWHQSLNLLRYPERSSASGLPRNRKPTCCPSKGSTAWHETIKPWWDGLASNSGRTLTCFQLSLLHWGRNGNHKHSPVLTVGALKESQELV